MADRDEGDVAGFAWLELRAAELHVPALLLEPAHRGRGVGGRALDLIVERHRADADAVELAVDAHNVAARRVHERDGFECTGKRAGFLVMRRRI